MRACACLALLLLSLGAAAETWPERGPVTLITSNSPGSTPDVITRMVAEGLGEALGQRFIVENKPGGSSIIATVAAARARPDGYTLYISGNSALAANPHTLKSIPYDPERDLVPVSMVITSAPLLIVVHPDLPVSTVPELVKLARSKPNQITYGASGSLAPFIGDMLNRTAGVQLRQVRYKQTAESVQDTLAGRTHVNFIGKAMSLPLLKEGKLRVIAVAGRERYPQMPDVPALEEDYPGIAVEGWFVLLGPAGLPDEVAERARKALGPYLLKPSTQKVFNDLGLTSKGATTTQQARDFIRAESERWARIVKETGFKPR